MGIKLLSLSPFLKEKAHFLQGIYIINIGSVSSIKHCIIWQFLSGHKALWVYWPLSPSQTWLVATHWAPPAQRRCPAGQWITVQDRSSVPSPQSSSPVARHDRVTESQTNDIKCLNPPHRHKSSQRGYTDQFRMWTPANNLISQLSSSIFYFPGAAWNMIQPAMSLYLLSKVIKRRQRTELLSVCQL